MTASADLAITKTGPATVVAGSSVAYSLVVVNNGPSDAVSLTVTDTLPAGVTFVSATGTGWACSNTGNVSVTCTRPLLAAGATAPTITVTVTAPAQAGSLSNTASVASTTSDPIAGQQHLVDVDGGDRLGGPGDREDRTGDGGGGRLGRLHADRDEQRVPRTRRT